MSPISQLAEYAQRRRGRLSAAAEQAARSQAIYERITAGARTRRQRDFVHALEQGVSPEDLAEAVGLGVEDVLAIVASS